jgi:O-antigen/teichoic acid export membrane protein
MLARGESDADIAHTVVTAAAASIFIGLVVAAIAYFAAGYIPRLLAGQPARLQQQAVAGLRLLAVATPMLFAGTLFSGVLSGYRRFGQVNGVRIVASALGALGPAVASSWWPDLVVACGLLVLVRIGVAVVHLLQCLRLPAAAARTTAWPPTSQEVSALLCFGGWLTVSNVLGPFMAYMDRFYLAAVRPVEEVAHYVAPYELATRVALIPAGVLPVVFPILVARWVHRETTEPRLLAQLAAAMALGCALPAAGLAVFGPEIMRAWTGLQLSADSATVLQLLAGAVFVNCVAQVFFMQLQAMGQTHLLARVHAAELVFYALLLWSVTSRWGVVGVALAWTVRVMVDSCVLCALSSLRLPPAVRHTCWQVLAMSITFGVALSASAWLPSPMWRAIAPVALILLLVGLRRRVLRLFGAAEPSVALAEAV